MQQNYNCTSVFVLPAVTAALDSKLLCDEEDTNLARSNVTGSLYTVHPPLLYTHAHSQTPTAVTVVVLK